MARRTLAGQLALVCIIEGVAVGARRPDVGCCLGLVACAAVEIRVGLDEVEPRIRVIERVVFPACGDVTVPA